jgi:hypothetical protein
MDRDAHSAQALTPSLAMCPRLATPAYVETPGESGLDAASVRSATPRS